MEMKYKNKEYIYYTFIHKIAYSLMAEKMLSSDEYAKMYKRIKYHDLDKLRNYFIMDKKMASKLHKRVASHHNPKTRLDFIESMIDMECARYTKADKPLNAYQTVIKYKENYTKEQFNSYMKLFEEFNIRNEDCSKDDDIVKKINLIQNFLNN